ncbi:MAG: M23 family metallopeptidase [Cytophagales bacterium]
MLSRYVKIDFTTFFGWGIFAFVFLLLAQPLSAQLKLSTESKVEGEASNLSGYLFPVNPGQPNFLAGTMGELRSTHFHAGIDVRTNSSVGVPIRATQNGYVSKVIVGSYGYGHALLLQHPDGNTSLYGHLDQFKGPIANFVLNEQYKRKSFDLDISLEPNQFPISKGDTIALSGNTGGSSGPHLHFEIRNEKNEALNPLAFGFTEITDKFSPVAFRIALKTLDQQSRVNDKFGRMEFGLVRSGNSYRLPYPIFAHGNIGVEILAHDKLDLSQFRCGINQIQMFVDSALVFSQTIDKIDFNKTRGIVTLMDYKSLKTKGARFNKLYIEDGNALPFYSQNNKGVISVISGTRNVKIVMHDLAGHEATANFNLQFDPITEKLPLLETYTKPISYEIQENVLAVHANYVGKPETLTLYIKGTKETLTADYFGNGHEVFLVNLKKGMPDSLTVGHERLKFAFKDVVPSGTDYTYYEDKVKAFFPNGSLYDTLYMQVRQYSRNNRTVTLIGDPLVPIKYPMQVTLKMRERESASDKNAVYHLEGNRYEYVGGRFSNGEITFSSPDLGEFVIAADSIPPTINNISISNRSARLRIRDNLSGIEKIEANIDGQWLLMKYDYKTGIVQSERLNKDKLLKGMFELKVTDRAGNERMYAQKIL